MKAKELQDKISGADKRCLQCGLVDHKRGTALARRDQGHWCVHRGLGGRGRAPDLAPLLPIPAPTARATPTSDATSAADGVAAAATATPSIDPTIATLLAQDPINYGAWLYSENCVICHLGYATARQSSTLDDETVRDTIINGKVASTMPKFGLLNGGNLRRAQVDAIVRTCAPGRSWAVSRNCPRPLPSTLPNARVLLRRCPRWSARRARSRRQPPRSRSPPFGKLPQSPTRSGGR